MKLTAALLLVCLFVLPTLADKREGITSFKVPAHRFVTIGLKGNPNFKTATFHVSSKFAVTAFFTTKEELSRAKTYDANKFLGPCSVIHVKDADVSCENPNSDTLVVWDTRDEISTEINPVEVRLVHYYLPPPRKR